MKKLLLFVAAIAFSCSSSDDSPAVQISPKINPPVWIHGTWLLQGSSIQSGFKFTSDDVCMNHANTYACNKEGLNLYQGTQVYTDVKEEISDSKYYVEITIGSNVTSYKFEKVSPSTIKWLNGVSNTIYTKQ